MLAQAKKIEMEDADTCQRINEPITTTNNPLVIKALLNFCCLYNKLDSDDADFLTEVFPMDPVKLLDFEGKFTLKTMFKKAFEHFEHYLFGEATNDKLEHILALIYCARKGIKPSEL